MSTFDDVQDPKFVEAFIQQLVRRPYGIASAGYFPSLLHADPRRRASVYGTLLNEEDREIKLGRGDESVMWTLAVGRVAFSVLGPTINPYTWVSEVFDRFLGRIGNNGQRFRDAIGFFENLDPACTVGIGATYKLLTLCEESAAWKLEVLNRLLHRGVHDCWPLTSSTNMIIYAKGLMVAAATTPDAQKKAYDKIIADALAEEKAQTEKAPPKWLVISRSPKGMMAEVVVAPSPETALAAANYPETGASTDRAVLPLDVLSELWVGMLGRSQLPVLVWQEPLSKKAPRLYPKVQKWPGRESFAGRKL